MTGHYVRYCNEVDKAERLRHALQAERKLTKTMADKLEVLRSEVLNMPRRALPPELREAAERHYCKNFSSDWNCEVCHGYFPCTAARLLAWIDGVD